MTRWFLLSRAIASTGLALGVVGCSSGPLPVAGPPTDVNRLAAPPAQPPAGLSGLAQLERALMGVARCHDVGGQRTECALLTSSDHPFQLLTFADDTTKQNYLTNVHANDIQARGRGLIPDGALVGGDWAAVPKVATPGLIPTLYKYLGGQSFS